MRQPRLSSLNPRVLLAVTAVALLAAFFLRDGSDEPVDGDTPARETVVRVVFAEFGGTEDLVYVATAADPDERTLVATVRHASGWAMTPSPTMSGTRIAFTALPAGSPPRRDAPAELWLLDVATGELERLARDADLLVPPVFDRDGKFVVYRSSGEAGTQTLVRVDLASRARRVIYELRTTFGVFPVGFDAAGSLLLARLSTQGTDIEAVANATADDFVAGGTDFLLHASDEIARDWRLAPDGRSLSFVAPEVLAERVVHRLHVFDLGGTPSEVTPDAEIAGTAALGEQFSPVWMATGTSVTVGREAFPELSASAVTFSLNGEDPLLLARPAQGFDVPLGWSADGRYLAARSFSGSTAQDAGIESLVLIARDGTRTLITAERELIFLGWLIDA